MPDPADRCSDEVVRLRAEVKRLRAKIKLLTPNIAALLKRRGFAIYKKEPVDDLLIPAKRHLAAYYRMLHRYSFRLFLRDVIKHHDSLTVEKVTRYATPDVTRTYLDYLLSIRLLRKKGEGFAVARQPIRSFGATLEWFVAELLKREFNCEAVWGVKFRRPKVGGDYDVIAKYDGSLLYVEVKSSPPKQIYDGEIEAFLDRVDDLSPEIAIFLMDTELRMKDKIVPMFEKELGRRSRPQPVIRMERELFRIEDRIYIVNSRDDMLRNVQKVLSRQYRKT
jgi:Holliday junction resolvase-like predicted endonuclease